MASNGQNLDDIVSTFVAASLHFFLKMTTSKKLLLLSFQGHQQTAQANAGTATGATSTGDTGEGDDKSVNEGQPVSGSSGSGGSDASRVSTRVVPFDSTASLQALSRAL